MFSPGPSLSHEAIFRAVVSAEASSSHPLAHALCRYSLSLLGFPDSVSATEAGFALTATDFENIDGSGVRCRVDGQLVCVGNRRMMAEGGVAVPDVLHEAGVEMEENGETVGFVLFVRGSKG